MARSSSLIGLPLAGLCLAGSALAGCSSLDGPSLADAAASTAPASLGVAVPPERALASLPAEAGAVVSVVERRSADGEVKQTITLAGDPGARGVDGIEVTAREQTYAAASRRIDADAVRAEMDEAFPDVAMTVSPRVVTTPTGPVGLATGSAGNGVSCLYAWSNGTLRRSTPTRAGLLSFAEASTNDVRVRVRLCRKGMSEDRLAALAEGLRIASDLGPASPALPRAAGSDALASAGYGATVPAAVATAPVAPSAPPAASTATRAPRQIAKTAPARAVEHPVATKPAPKTDAPIAVAAPIPLPSGG